MGFINTYVNGCIPPQNSFNYYYKSSCTASNPSGNVPGTKLSWIELSALWKVAYELLDSEFKALEAAIELGNGTTISSRASDVQTKLSDVVKEIERRSGLVTRGFLQNSDYTFTFGTSSTIVAATSNSSYSVGSSPQIRAEVIGAYLDSSVLYPGYRFSSSDKSTNAYIAGGVGGNVATNGCQDVPALVFRLAFNVVSS